MEALELDDIQALVRHGYPGFKAADYRLLRFGDDVAGTKRWLGALRAHPGLASAALRAPGVRALDCGIAIAFTATGLRRLLGASDGEMHSFVMEFQEGMTAEHRARLLGDIGANAPSSWYWGYRDGIDALLVVYWQFDEYGWAEVAPPVKAIQELPGFPAVVKSFTGILENTEPFGFADGISQPFVEGLELQPPPRGVRPVRAGEFVLGYPNELGGYPVSPTVPMDDRARGLLRELPGGRADFGRNGTYLVLRQLEQHVDAFEAFVAGDERIAARMVGRWKNGSPLVRYPEPDLRQRGMRELEAENDFGYHREDRHGFRCPVGAHIRRANPRDGLADGTGMTPERAQAIVDRHRLLRRGRVYYERKEQGLLFMCLNANIERQFEFVQSVWIMNREFAGLQNEMDPLLGCTADGTPRSMTLQHPRMPRRMAGLQQFVTVRGGAYFFIPGLKALEYLSK